MTNHAVSNRADLRERTKTMSRHGDRWGQIADFRGSFETINWLYLLFKCGIKTKTHFEWLLWHWSSLGQLNLEPTGLTASWVAKCQLTSWRSVSKKPHIWVFIIVSISLGFPYMVMLRTFKRKRHCCGCGVAIGLLWTLHCPRTIIFTSQYYNSFTEYAWTWAEHLSKPRQREFTAITGALPIDWFCSSSMRFVAYFYSIALYIQLDATVKWGQFLCV